jgi:hypothetical protein
LKYKIVKPLYFCLLSEVKEKGRKDLLFSALSIKLVFISRMLCCSDNGSRPVTFIIIIIIIIINIKTNNKNWRVKYVLCGSKTQLK